jgi:hypothetical protein
MDTASKWLETGLEYFTRTGKVDLNQISKQLGLSKSSFYNIYVTENGRKPLEKYRDDVLDELERRLDAILTLGKQLTYDNPVPESYRMGLEVIRKNYIVYRAIGQFAIMPNDKRAFGIYEKIQGKLYPLIQHNIKRMYPNISDVLLKTIVTGLLYAATLFMVHEPNPDNFVQFALKAYDDLYFASLETNK